MEEIFVPTAEGLVEYVKACMHTPHVYLWAGNGEYLTDAELDRLEAKYPTWYTEELVAVRRSLVDRGIRGWDCLGLILSYKWGDYHQGNTALYKPEEFMGTTRLFKQEGLVKGKIETLPERPGLVVYMHGHVGVYIGDGWVIECTRKNVKTWEYELIGGIHQTRLSDRPWTHWLEMPGIRY